MPIQPGSHLLRRTVAAAGYTLTSASPSKGVRYTFDPGLYYNPDAIAIRMPQPQQEPDEMQTESRAKEKKEPLHRLMPGYERYQIIARLYNVALKKTLMAYTGSQSGNR